MSRTERRSIAAIKRYRAMKMARLISRAYHYNRRGDKAAVYNLVGDELLSLGGIYIKFLQTIMLQSQSMLKYWRHPNRYSIFERLSTEPLDIHRVLDKELGDDAKRLRAVSPEPFAAGSFGQVYMAKLDGRDVVVKLMRPRVAELLRFDLKLLRYFWRVCKRHLNTARGLDMAISFNDFATQTLGEVDYGAEAEFAAEQYAAYRDHPKLVIPKTHLDLCRPNLIVQDYVGGVSVTHLVELHAQGVDIIKYVKNELGSDVIDQFQTVFYEIIWGVFSLPRIMGDAHPGNVKLLRKNKVALIDFGIAAVPGENQAALFNLIVEYGNLVAGRFNPGQMFVSYLRFFGRDLYRALRKFSIILPRKIDLNQELGQLAEANLNQTIGSKELERVLRSPKAITIFDQLTNQDNRLALKTRVEDGQVIRAGLAFCSLLANLDLYHPVVAPVYKSVIPRINEAHPDLMTKTDPEMSSAQAIDILSSWLEQVANRNPNLFQDIMRQLQLPNNLDQINNPEQLKFGA